MAAAKRMTKAQVIGEIAQYSELDKKSVSKVFEGLTDLIKKQLGPRGPGEFVIPGLSSSRRSRRRPFRRASVATRSRADAALPGEAGLEEGPCDGASRRSKTSSSDEVTASADGACGLRTRAPSSKEDRAPASYLCQENERDRSSSRCNLCEASGGLRIEAEGGRVTQIRGDEEDPFSRGYLCPKAFAL
jgi:hypothetical protein